VSKEHFKPLVEKVGRGGLILSLLATTSCAAPKVVPTAIEVTAAPLATAKTGEKFQPLPSLIHQYYPELETSGLTLYQVETLAVRSDKQTYVYNFIEENLNLTSALSIYGYFDSLVSSSNPVILQHYPISGQDRNIRVLPQSQINKRATVIIPENAPKPSWPAAVDLANQPAATYYPGDTAFSYVKQIHQPIGIFRTPSEVLTAEFAIEACQQTLKASVIDEKGNPVISPEEALIGQEAVCNSLGTAVAARLLNKTYQEYFDYVSRGTMGLTKEGEKIGFISVTPRSYEALSPDGPILR
jgi:hypothetical protein